MNRWIKKIHMYTGLFNFTILVVFGIVGLTVTFLPTPGERSHAAPEVRHVAFPVPGGLDDKQLAKVLYATLQLPLSYPAPDYQIRRGTDHNLRVRFGNPSKMYDVVVLENESRVRIEMVPHDFWQFLFHLHESTPQNRHPHWQTQLWAWYVEVSVWSLTAMALTGVYLWLTSRPKLRWAQLSFAAGSGMLLLFYLLVR